MQLARLLRRIQHFQVHASAAIDQRRIADQGLRALADFHDLLQLAEIPGGDAGQRGLGLGDGAELFSRLLAQLRAQCGQVPAHGQLPAVLVHHAEIHGEMRGQEFGAKPVQRQHQVQFLARVAGDGFDQGKVVLALRLGGRHRTELVGEFVGEFGQRPELVTDFLRQGLRQQRDFFLEQARHQPVAARSRYLVECDQRHGEREAVARIARVVQVFERVTASADGELVRKLRGGDAGRLVPHQVLALEVEQLRLVGLSGTAPVLERCAVVDANGDQAVVKGVDQLLVHQHVGAARLMFERLDVADQLAVVLEKRRARLVLALDQRLADEYPARFGRIERAVVDAPVGVEQDAVQGRALERGDAGGLLLPVRLVLVAPDQVRAHALQPLRLDARDAASVQARGFGDLRGHDPAPGLLAHARTGVDLELDAARAEVKFAVLGLAADVAEQAGKQRAVDLRVARLLSGQLPSQLGDESMQLAVDVQPLAHAVVGEEVFPAQIHQLAVRFLVRERLLVELPQLEPGEEIGFFVVELELRRVGGARALQRPLARVLQRQHRPDNQHLGQAALLFRREDHARDAGVERQARELPAGLGQVVRIVHRAQFAEQAIAVADRLGQRRIEKRKILDLAQMQRLHPQDHAGERRAQQFGLGVGGSRLVVVLVVQAYAHAARHAAAATGALVGARLGDLLHLQLLDLAAVAVALDARFARIDDVAYARNRERGLGDIRRKHDAPASVRLEHPLLLRRRQPCEERQDLGVRGMVLAQGLGRLADLALARQEYQHVAGTAAGGFVDRIDDGVGQIRYLINARARRGSARRSRGRGRPVTDLDRIQTTGHLDHRRTVEMPGEALCVYGRGGYDHLQIWPPRQQLLQITEQEIDIEAALVRLVDNDRVVQPQIPVALGLGEQNAVGHQLDVGARAGLVVETDLVADRAAGFGLQLLRDARRGRARGDTPRLRVADEPRDAATEFEQDLGQLGSLARARLAADDEHLVFGDRLRDVGAPRADRQLFRVLDLRQRGAALLELRGGVAVLLRIHAPAIGLLGFHPRILPAPGMPPEQQRRASSFRQDSIQTGRPISAKAAIAQRPAA